MFSRVASAGVAAFRRPVTAFTPSLWARSMATVQPAVLNRDMGRNQWYVHLSRTEGADLNVIKKVISDLRADCSKKGVNLVVGFGPTLLADITSDMPADFQPYETFKSTVRPHFTCICTRPVISRLALHLCAPLDACMHQGNGDSPA